MAVVLGNALLGTACDSDTELASFSASATVMTEFYYIMARLSCGVEEGREKHFLNVDE